MDRLMRSYSRWKNHPRKWDILYIFGKLRAAKKQQRLLRPPIDTNNVEILFDPEFRKSVDQVKNYTLLDVARLANLWYLARLAGPGVYLEVGSYQGGGALHICNAIDARGNPFYCFDPFEKGGFEKMSENDTLFRQNEFMETQYQAVVKLLSGKPNAKVIQGYFPAEAENIELDDIAFCHLDVDVYEATREGLEFLASRLAPRSLIVLDDMNRKAEGVEKAVAEFLAAHPSFLLLPMFPSQGVLLSKALW